MPRANRYYIPGHIWHITHRCHKKEFLLKFSKDRKRWLHWLFEAKKRFGLKVLNYIVTSNHIHLLVLDSVEGAIAKSIQLRAGRTAQEYNQRKDRKGAFWEDRYHATAIESGKHLIQCMVYIDLNMVRAGVVNHPSEWSSSGYNEIQNPPSRYSLIDRKGLMELCGWKDEYNFKKTFRETTEEFLARDKIFHDHRWTESVAVGGESYVEETKEKLGLKGKDMKIQENHEIYTLRQEQSPYKAHFGGKKGTLSPENTYSWNVFPLNSSA